MPITGFCHYTVVCRDLDASAAFYRDVLAMEVRPRPLPPGYPRAAIGHFADGVWCVHLFQASDDQKARFGAPAEAGTGVMKHIALRAEGYARMADSLRDHGVTFREFTLGDRHLVQFLDPDGLEIELAFPPAELPNGPVAIPPDAR